MPYTNSNVKRLFVFKARFDLYSVRMFCNFGVYITTSGTFYFIPEPKAAVFQPRMEWNGLVSHFVS